jgi:hypothetical protein
MQENLRDVQAWLRTRLSDNEWIRDFDAQGRCFETKPTTSETVSRCTGLEQPKCYRICQFGTVFFDCAVDPPEDNALLFLACAGTGKTQASYRQSTEMPRSLLATISTDQDALWTPTPDLVHAVMTSVSLTPEE